MEAEDLVVDGREASRGRGFAEPLLLICRGEGLADVDKGATLARDFLRTGLVSLDSVTDPSTTTQLLREAGKVGRAVGV